MTKEEFKIRCLGAAPTHLKTYIPKAVEFVSDAISDPFTSANVRLAIKFAGVLHGENLQFENAIMDKVEVLAALKINPLGIIVSEELHKQMLHDIEEIRMKFFGQKDPPYPEDIEKAVEWLEKECLDEVNQIRAKPQLDYNEFTKLITAAIPRYLRRKNDRLLTHDLKFSIERLTIPYRDKDGLPKRKQIYRGTPLYQLAEATKTMSADTDFSQDSILTFILTGTKPYLPAFKMRSVIKKSNKVQVDFFRGLDYDEFLSLHSKIRKSFSPRKKSLKEKNLEVYFLVSDLGGVPKKKKVEFWKKVKAEWNQIHPKEKYRNPDCLRIIYQRILKNVKPCTL